MADRTITGNCYRLWTLILILFCFLAPTPTRAQNGPDQDHTLSPYFFVEHTAEGVDALPLRSTAVTVDIAGVIADVKVKQVYQNTGSRPLEAIYVFPGSTRAAVYGMKMIIGERVQEAREV